MYGFEHPVVIHTTTFPSAVEVGDPQSENQDASRYPGN
jgi:hypothetical protein